MINDCIENIDRSNEDDYEIELQHSAYYCMNSYIEILRQYARVSVY